MRELRLVAVSEDGTSLVVSAGGDERFRLPIDERVRAAVRLDRDRLGQLEIKVESALRPREIQARIRAGEAADDIARVAGVPVEYVRRFEYPVLREREHVATAARALPAQRESPDAGSLEAVVTARLAEQGVNADELRWDAWKLDERTWIVEARWSATGAPASARFTYDSVARAVRPADVASRALVLGEDAGNVRELAPRVESGGEEPAEEPAPPRTRSEGEPGRRKSSVPTWDEVMFGTRRRE